MSAYTTEKIMTTRKRVENTIDWNDADSHQPHKLRNILDSPDTVFKIDP